VNLFVSNHIGGRWNKEEMDHLGKFIRATLVGGLLVLFPLFGLVYFILFIGRLLTSTIKPFIGLLPGIDSVSLPFANILSILVLILMCFLVGVFVKTRPGIALTSWLTRVLEKIPLYIMLRRIGEILFDQEDPRGTPVLVHLDNAKQIGFMIEQHGSEGVTVFFPSAPSPLGGSIMIVSPDKVEKLNVRAADVARVIGTFGAGTDALLVGRDTH